MQQSAGGCCGWAGDVNIRGRDTRASERDASLSATMGRCDGHNGTVKGPPAGRVKSGRPAGCMVAWPTMHARELRNDESSST